MSTYHSLINEGKERLYKAGQGEQAAQLFMVELCRQKDINLYISMDEEADEQIQTDYLEGIHLMENGEPLGYNFSYHTINYLFHIPDAFPVISIEYCILLQTAHIKFTNIKATTIP